MSNPKMRSPKRIIIIGGNAAGVSAAAAARKTDRYAEIIMIEADDHPAYSRCGLPFVIEGKIPRFEDLLIYPPNYYRMMKIDLRLKTTATAIDKEAKTVEIEDSHGKRDVLEYDSLILATGAYPFAPPIRGRDKMGVFTVRTLRDGGRINRAVSDAKSAVVIGAGLIGLEMAAAFARRGIRTTIVELLPQVLPAMLDEDMAILVQEGFEKEGVEVITGHGVDEILGGDEVEGISAAGREIAADLVIIATGVRPSVELAKEAGVEIGKTRAIKTNLRMRTSVEDIYAAGDCVESVHMVTHAPVLSQLGTVAIRQGMVAGINAGGGYAIFPGVLGSAVSKLFDLEVGATGLTERQAEQAGVKTVVGFTMAETRARYYPGALPITVKLIFEERTRRLIGGQIVGGEGVAPRINALSLAIQKQMTAWEMVQADTCYTPPLSDYMEPSIQIAAQVALGA